MRPFLTVSLLLISVSAVSCSFIQRFGVDEDRHRISEITLDRVGTAWLGGGRDGYTVSLRSDGTAKYEGFVNARRNGKYRGKIQGERFAKLAKLINRNEFFSLKGEYFNPTVADGYIITTSIVYDGGRKVVKDYEEGGGDELSEIERAIQDAAEQIAWEKDEH